MCGSELEDQKCPICDTGDEQSSEEQKDTDGSEGMNMPAQDEESAQ